MIGSTASFWLTVALIDEFGDPFDERDLEQKLS
jgi:hypothetical protein